MAFNEYYIAPTSGNDTTGDGTIGTPWATLQKALDTVTARSGGNPDRMNMKAGEEDSTSATLSFTTYGSPTETAFLLIQGYSSAAGDGGIGILDGGGTASIIDEAGTLDFTHIRDMILRDCGNNEVVRWDDFCSMVNCLVTGTTGSAGYGVHCDNSCCYVGNTFTDLGAAGIRSGGGSLIYLNEFGGSGANVPADAWYRTDQNEQGNCVVMNKVILTNGGEDAFRVGGSDHFLFNSVWSNGGTGAAFDDTSAAGRAGVIMNNIVSGLSGTGGHAFHLDHAGTDVQVFGGNHTHNCDTDYDLPANIPQNLGQNNTNDSTAPFTDAANDDFTPVDVASVKQGALPAGFRGDPATNTNKRWLGAVEPAEPAGGGGGTTVPQTLHPIDSGIAA